MTAAFPILIVNTAASIPVMVQEQLRVYDNGRSVLHIQAAADPQRRDQAGTYETTLDESGLKSVRGLVEELLASAPQDSDRFPGGVKSTLTVSDGQRSQTFLLPAQFVASASPVLTRAAASASDIMAAAFAKPLAALRLSAKTKTGSGAAASLLLTCASIGSEPVNFLLHPASLVVQVEVKNKTEVLWQNSAGKAVGLIDGAGKLVDGMYTAAHMPPESTATAVYAQVLPAIQPAMALHLEGWIELQGPERETAVLPQDKIRLTATITS
jgi:hypothetical protein